MRFITEFEVPEYFENNKRMPYVPEKRHLCEVKMGNLIAESFGWQNPVNHNLEHHRLEIEAFPMDKWVEFKNSLLSNLNYDIDGIKNMVEAFEILESFSKLSETNKNKP